MKKNTSNTKCPNVKWGSLVASIILVVLELALVILHFYANSGAMADADITIGFVAAYGWLFGILALLVAALLFFEEFLPSYIKYATWKNFRNYKSEVAKATRASLVSNSRKEGKAYLELLETL